MPRLAVILIMLLLAGLACSLSSDEEAATAVPIIRTSTPTLTITQTLNVTSTPGITLQPTAEQFRTAAPPATVINCTPRTDWVFYTIKAGDTLGVIAQNVGSTITDLTRANCLPNPDSIVVGQQLRVPKLPASTTSGSTTSGSTTTGSTTSGSTTSSTGSTTSGSTTGSTTSGDTSKTPKLTQNLSAAPVITLSASEVVTLQPSISLNVGVVENADTVKYFASDAANLSGAVNVGTDVDPFDGTAITYTFNEFDSVLYFYAEAANEFG
ncbi:MAG: LysM peptidoglycan-binding domain-containing protein, partial [Anaerolineae bacterium]|nr:LysM peptidoglycan-binding domain-containing protein [Anaerolineae bacterium]